MLIKVQFNNISVFKKAYIVYKWNKANVPVVYLSDQIFPVFVGSQLFNQVMLNRSSGCYHAKKNK
jgi:hypothetical protein